MAGLRDCPRAPSLWRRLRPDALDLLTLFGAPLLVLFTWAAATAIQNATATGFAVTAVGVALSGLALIVTSIWSQADARRPRSQEWLDAHPDRIETLPVVELPDTVSSGSISALQGRPVGLSVHAMTGSPLARRTRRTHWPEVTMRLSDRPTDAGTIEHPWVFWSVCGQDVRVWVANFFYHLSPDGRTITGYVRSSAQAWTAVLFTIATAWVAVGIIWTLVTGHMLALMAVFVGSFFAFWGMAIRWYDVPGEQRLVAEYVLLAVFERAGDAGGR
ncbi:hypothetical protein K8W59_02735 [Nocardioides rotundus]|uniref:hypothetical protein n=1 Tax=Nocardioides rotundus TaxID=1774216 RepID=UPI001CBC946C|nr:hypothetical protein [Nocardioides rotundus]UAL30458.1 hypothetical protein K8W59_02735 [Nocardioides rotundus]